MLHKRIDPTVKFMRKKQPTIKQKSVQVDKSTSVPPIGAPSWCLNEEALNKFNRPTNNIPIYDYDTEDHGNNNNDSENDITNDNESREKRRKSNNNEGRENKKRKKSSKQKRRKNSKRSKNKHNHFALA